MNQIENSLESIQTDYITWKTGFKASKTELQVLKIGQMNFDIQYAVGGEKTMSRIYKNAGKSRCHI